LLEGVEDIIVWWQLMTDDFGWQLSLNCRLRCVAGQNKAGMYSSVAHLARLQEQDKYSIRILMVEALDFFNI
jgi:hypothetical protein